MHILIAVLDERFRPEVEELCFMSGSFLINMAEDNKCLYLVYFYIILMALNETLAGFC